MSENIFNAKRLNSIVSNNRKPNTSKTIEKEMPDEDISFIQKITDKKEEYEDFIKESENTIHLPDNFDVGGFITKYEDSDSILFNDFINNIIHIKIKYLNDNVKRLKKIDKGDWIDLYAAESIRIDCGKFALINLGVAMKLPKGYEAHVLPRSSTFKKWGIIMTNSMGIIDNSYCGDNDWWRFPAYCLEPKYFDDDINSKGHTFINAGDKIAQFRIAPIQGNIDFDEVDHFGTPDRGGFGSTGSV